jgi:phosphoglycerate dehydrogenase-like enzyme
VRALSNGWIAGAGLDVFEEEPLPKSSPLWGMDNVIITSHYSGLTPHYNQRALAIFLDNLARYRAGRPLRNVVDKSLGY